MSAIAADFGPADLAPAISRSSVDHVVSVQARQSLDETRWLLKLADEHAFVAGVVGWAPLADAAVGEALESLAADPRLRAIRHVVHDEPDDNFILRDDFNCGVDLLDRFGLAYDLLVFERHLPQTIAFVDRHPETRFVLDHIAKPRIADGEMEPWRTNIARLAERPNVWCKISGMVTEADWRRWSPGKLLPYFRVVLECFGAQRLMFGSDWPVCLVACDYADWATTVLDWISNLSEAEQASIRSGAAIEAYRLPIDGGLPDNEKLLL